MRKYGRFLFGVVNLLFLAVLLNGCATSTGRPPNTSNQTAHRIYRALPEYARMLKTPWPVIHLSGPLKVGMQSQNIPTIRNRLILLGDLSKHYASNSVLFDGALETAVMQLQWRHGVKADGAIGPKTLRALNVPPAQRLAQLRHSMNQWAEFPEDIGSRYIRVNIPSYQLDLIKDGNKVLNMKVVVGKTARPTPTLYSKIQTVVFNPKWNVPKVIVNEDIVPKVINNPNYLAENNISIYSSWKKDAYTINSADIDWQKAMYEGFPHRMTQAPGPLKPLGRVKFIFLNEHDVYLHDTPQKGIFGQIQRAYSSGCVRLEKPFQLVEYFIQENPELEHEKLNEYLSEGDIKYVKIQNPMPIYITYITAWVDKNGVSHFREDIYKKSNYSAPSSRI